MDQEGYFSVAFFGSWGFICWEIAVFVLGSWPGILGGDFVMVAYLQNMMSSNAIRIVPVLSVKMFRQQAFEGLFILMQKKNVASSECLLVPRFSSIDISGRRSCTITDGYT